MPINVDSLCLKKKLDRCVSPQKFVQVSPSRHFLRTATLSSFTMLTMQVAEVEALKNNLLPFLQLSQFVNFKFSRSTVSLTASCPHTTSCLYVQLKISEPFFTFLSTNPNGIEEYHSCLQIDDFFLATSLTGTDDRIVTFLMPDDYSFTNILFTTCTSLDSLNNLGSDSAFIPIS